MPMFPTSHLTPEALATALELARHLQGLATELARLAPSRPSRTDGRRAEAQDRALVDWVGPHADTFRRLCLHEAGSADLVEFSLRAEAEAWAQFWADATNARARRLHDQAMAEHRAAGRAYEAELADYHLQAGVDPTSVLHRPPPTPPGPPPLPPPPVRAPTADSGYRPWAG